MMIFLISWVDFKNKMDKEMMDKIRDEGFDDKVKSVPAMLLRVIRSLEEEKARSTRLEAKIKMLEERISDLKWGTKREIELASTTWDNGYHTLAGDCYKLNNDHDDFNERLERIEGILKIDPEKDEE